MSDKDDKNYLIKHGWSYTGRFPHSWRDPESQWPTNTDEAMYSIADAVAIQAKRDHVELPPPPPEPQIATRIVIETIQKADAGFADAGLDPLSPERMAVDRVGQMLREEIELASGRRRAGSFGTRKNEYRKPDTVIVNCDYCQQRGLVNAELFVSR